MEVALKNLAEDAAYTFKGLYKTADALRITYKVYVLFPVLFSLCILGFPDVLTQGEEKLFSIICIFFGFLLFYNQKKYELIPKYHRIANRYKTIYDRLMIAHNEEKKTDFDEVRSELEKLREETPECEINCIGRYWAKFKINKEMNLDWLKGPK